MIATAETEWWGGEALHIPTTFSEEHQRTALTLERLQGVGETIVDFVSQHKQEVAAGAIITTGVTLVAGTTAIVAFHKLHEAPQS